MEEIKGEDYIVTYDPETLTFTFHGELALGGPPEYQPIKDLLYKIAENEPATMTLDLRELEFFNSSGISLISRFILSLRKKKGLQLKIFGCDEIAWQSKSLKNFKKLLPNVELQID